MVPLSAAMASALRKLAVVRTPDEKGRAPATTSIVVVRPTFAMIRPPAAAIRTWASRSGSPGWAWLRPAATVRTLPAVPL